MHPVMPDIDESMPRIVSRVHDTATISPNSRQALLKKPAIVQGMHASDNETQSPHKLERPPNVGAASVASSFETARSLSSGAHSRDPLAPPQDEVGEPSW
jgi:hypothetical protein